MRARCLPFTALLLAGTALAVRPQEGAPAGGEPVRVRTVNPQVQRLLSSDEAWQRFVAAEGAGWEARFDEVTGTPVRLWGSGLDLGPLPDEAAAGRAALAWVGAHADLLGLGAAVPDLRSAAYVPSLDAWYVDVDTVIDGLPVWRGGVTLRVRHDRLVMVGADTYPRARVVNRHVLDADAAVKAWLAGGPVPWVDHADAAAIREVLLPEVHGKTATLRRVWEVTSRTAAPLGRWEGLVDAETGEVVAFWNTLRFADGQLWIEHDDRLGRGALMVSPLSNATVQGGGDEVVTDASGRWSLADADGFTVSLDGPRVAIHDEAETVPAPAIEAPDDTIRADDLGGSQASASTFVFVQQVQDYAATFADDVSWVHDRASAHVNVDDTCNAYFDGTLHFFRAGRGCRNTGRLADVVYHEWGHGFHYASIVSGSFDGSLGEGAADVMSFLMTGDHELAPGFFDDDKGPLRDALNHLRWPDDYVADENYVHENGMLFSGSIWDTREILRDGLGEPAATRVIESIYAGLLKGGPSLTTAYDEAVFADDDDADLSNGTPHQCALVSGFGNHGLGPLGGFGITPTLTRELVVQPGRDVDVALELPNPAPDCYDVRPVDGTLWWSVDGGSWLQAPLHVAGSGLTATIPGDDLALGDVLSWYVTVGTNTGGTVTEPVGGPIRPHTVYVGDTLQLRCFDFEKGDGGFTHRLISGDDVEGADDWRWGTPLGLGGDPSDAASGRRVWGTDLGGDNFNGEYQSEKETELRSPKLDTRHYEGVFLSYARWLTVEDGYYDHATIAADDTEVWRNWGTDVDRGTDHTLDDGWSTHVVDLQGEGDDGEVRLAWRLESDQGLEFGGWTLDDVCLLAPDTPDNRLGISDFTATRAEGVVTLAWTMPRHEPVEAVRVVRTRGWWPDGPDDGEVVFETSDVTVEAPTTATDAATQDDLYYAVYASDGSHWLSWTREGLNAAAVDPTPEGDPVTDDGGKGCACTDAPASPSTAVVALLLATLRRRKRAHA
jgi:hypothetical protein